MGNFRTLDPKARLASFILVLVVHGALFYGLWQISVPMSVDQTHAVFVQLFRSPSSPELPEPPRQNARQPRPVNQLKRPELTPIHQIVVQEPVVESDVQAASSPLPAVTQPAAQASLETALPSPPVPVKPPGPIVLGGELNGTCPDWSPPAYPPLSRRLGEEGKTVLQVELGATGSVDHVIVKESSGFPRLDAAALATVKRWHCNPATREGKAVRAVAIQPFKFVLEEQ
jgi:protein TonB